MTRYWQYGKGMNGGTFPEGSYPVLLVHGFRGDHHYWKSSRTTC